MVSKRAISIHPQLQQCWGIDLEIFKAWRNLLSKDIIFFPENCNANPISLLVCDHGSRVTYNIHTKFEHTVKAAVRAWWTQDKKSHIHVLPAAAPR